MQRRVPRPRPRRAFDYCAAGERGFLGADDSAEIVFLGGADTGTAVRVAGKATRGATGARGRTRRPHDRRVSPCDEHRLLRESALARRIATCSRARRRSRRSGTCRGFFVAPRARQYRVRRVQLSRRLAIARPECSCRRPNLPHGERDRSASAERRCVSYSASDRGGGSGGLAVSLTRSRRRAVASQLFAVGTARHRRFRSGRAPSARRDSSIARPERSRPRREAFPRDGVSRGRGLEVGLRPSRARIFDGGAGARICRSRSARGRGSWTLAGCLRGRGPCRRRSS